MYIRLLTISKIVIHVKMFNVLKITSVPLPHLKYFLKFIMKSIVRFITVFYFSVVLPFGIQLGY
jgi:hypothetical protein